MSTLLFEFRFLGSMNELFFIADENGPITRISYNKLTTPRKKPNADLRSLSYIDPSTWNQIPDSLKLSKNLNSFKHNVKTRFLHEKGKSLFPFSVLLHQLHYVRTTEDQKCSTVCGLSKMNLYKYRYRK